MTGSAMIQIGIALVFLYTLFSLLCSVFNEWAARVAELRRKVLKSEIRHLLGAHLSGRLNAHPLILGLYEGKHHNRYPHYIPPLTFALALIDLTIDYKEAEKPGFPGKATVKVDVAEGGALAKSLLRNTSNLEALQERVAKWFELSMEQASGRYKRYSQLIIAGFAVMVAIAFNIDTISIFRSLYDQLAAGKSVPVFPIGSAAEPRSEIIHHLAGWMITAAALSLGAPFWFDLLNKLVNLRQTGLPPDVDPKARASA